VFGHTPSRACRGEGGGEWEEDRDRARILFFFSHQDDYSVLRNERALLKIFTSKKSSQ